MLAGRIIKRKHFNLNIIDKFGKEAFSFFVKVFQSRLIRNKKFRFVVIPALLIFGILFYGYYWYSYTYGSFYTATLKYQPKDIQENKIFDITNETASSIETVKLATEDSTSITLNTTGEKATGEKAMGKATIFNSTTDIKVIKAGTPLTCISNSCTGLIFHTATDLNLGPGTSDEVDVVASDMGENYNLSAGAGRFKVSNFDSKTEVLASNVKPISGGTPKRMVKIVSKNDIRKAEETALKTLKEQLKLKLNNEPDTEKYILANIENNAKVDKVSTEVDKKEGEEAEIINVSVKAKLTIDGIEKGKLDELVAQVKKGVTPDGYYLDEKLTQVNSSFTDKGKGKFEVAINLTSIARPNIDIESLKNNLAGKHISAAEDVLKKIPNLKEHTQNFEPKSLPQYFWTIPKNSHKIEIKLIADK